MINWPLIGLSNKLKPKQKSVLYFMRSFKRHCELNYLCRSLKASEIENNVEIVKNQPY